MHEIYSPELITTTRVEPNLRTKSANLAELIISHTLKDIIIPFRCFESTVQADFLRLMKITKPMMETNNNTRMHARTVLTMTSANALVIRKKYDFINI